MKPFLAFLVLWAPALTFGKTVGSGKVITETRNLSGVSGVEMAGSPDLTILQSDAPESLAIDGEDNILPLLETTVEKDGVLHIGLTSEAAPTKKIKMRLTVKSLNSIKVAGSGSVQAEKLVSNSAVEVKVIGSGNAKILGLQCSSWNATIAGSGDIHAAGSCKDQKVDIIGSGDYEGFDLESGAASVTVNGSGDCEINAKDKLDAIIAGSGDIDYKGSPSLTKKVTGSGAVGHAESK